MTAYLLRRLAASLLLVFLVLTASFFLIRIAPGGPLALYEASQLNSEQTQVLRQLYGLDRPLVEQYVRWLGTLLLEGEWGTSFQYHRPALQVLWQTIPYSFVLACSALFLQYVFGILLGVAAARKPGSWVDQSVRLMSMGLYSVPLFWLALMAILVFHVWWGLVPGGGATSVGIDSMAMWPALLDRLHHLALPAIVLGVTSAGALARFVRNSLIDNLSQDHVRTARAKGLSESRVLWMHGVRNSLVPLVQLLGFALPRLLNGVLVVEVVFAWPGLGRVMFDASMARDYPLILAGTVFSATLVIASNLLADGLHMLADPRVRHAHAQPGLQG